MANGITEAQGKEIIELLTDIRSELENVRGQLGYLDRLPDIDSSLEKMRASINEIAADVSRIEMKD